MARLWAAGPPRRRVVCLSQLDPAAGEGNV